MKRKLSDGREITELSLEEKLQSGETMSRRYLARANDGESFFMKTAVNSRNCSGSTSRGISRNEITILENIKDYASKAKAIIDCPNITKIYKETIEMEDRFCLFFKYIQGQKITLKHHIQVKDDFDKGVSFFEQKNLVKAESPGALPLHKAVEIATKLCQEIKRYHDFSIKDIDGIKDNDCTGIIVVDVTPDNIMIVENRELEVSLIDVGIARKKGIDSLLLFNGSVPGKVAGAYIGMVGKPLRNGIYTVPDVHRYQKALPSLDTYNLANIACLMLTGKLSEHWRQEAAGKELQEMEKMAYADEKEKEEKKEEKRSLADAKAVEELILQEITRIQKGRGDHDDGLSGTYRQLAEMIVKGTGPFEERYGSADEMLKVLAGLKLPAAESKKEDNFTVSIKVPEEYYKNIILPDLRSIYGTQADQAEMQMLHLATTKEEDFKMEPFFGQTEEEIIAAKRRHYFLERKAKEASARRRPLLALGAGILALGMTAAYCQEEIGQAYENYAAPIVEDLKDRWQGVFEKPNECQNDCSQLVVPVEAEPQTRYHETKKAEIKDLEKENRKDIEGIWPKFQDPGLEKREN